MRYVLNCACRNSDTANYLTNIGLWWLQLTFVSATVEPSVLHTVVACFGIQLVVSKYNSRQGCNTYLLEFPPGWLLVMSPREGERNLSVRHVADNKTM